MRRTVTGVRIARATTTTRERARDPAPAAPPWPRARECGAAHTRGASNRAQRAGGHAHARAYTPDFYELWDMRCDPGADMR